MKQFRFLVLFIYFLAPLLSFAQDREEMETNYKIPDTIPTVIDSLYREDQFYAGVSFNLLVNKPSTISQSAFSGGLHLGFTRDFPLNKRRNIGIAAGLGWSIDTYGQNLFIGENEGGETIFRSLNKSIDYSTNRFSMQTVEMPLEFRWRTSTPETYKFWRIYTGLKLGYVYYFRSNFVQPDNHVLQTDVPELDRMRLGATFTFGYNTFNFQFYYSLNSLFKDGKVDGEEIGMSPLKIGLMFYIL